MCDYQGYEFGAGRYPDSVCVDGKLYDADNCDDEGNLYDMGYDLPCPLCRPNDSIEFWFDHNKDCEIDNDEEALAFAISLVNDIRNNRGLDPVEYTAPAAKD